jgi:hypothetical protein
MPSAYHAGELRAQERAGVRAEADRLAGMISGHIPPVAARFLAALTLVFVAGRSVDGRLWVSPLAGPPGFAAAPDEETIAIAGGFPAADPLAGAFDDPADCGLIAVDFARRRRMRANGTAVREPGRLVLRTAEVFSNCPRFIHRREPTGPASGDDGSAARRVADGPELSAGQRAWIAAAEEFIIGSRAPGHGADCSHRGGDPGFVQATGPASLRWPDFPGNNMYATLGNLEVDPAAGLLFIDWERGRTLQLTGQARLTAEGGDRFIDFDIARAVETADRLPTARRPAAD